MCPAASSRWCPTPEQLMILEEMYRSGTRTPNASQIQNITGHLSFYGKIEGKNVFYWFQNHKARERQKLRKNLMTSKQLQQQQQQLINQKNSCHLLLDSPANSHVQQLTYNNSTIFLPQGGSELEDASTVPLKEKYTWKVEIPERAVEMEKKSTMRMYNNKHDWMMMMMDAGPPGPHSQCCSRPLKTLELFPITATNLRDERNPSKHISCYTMSATS